MNKTLRALAFFMMAFASLSAWPKSQTFKLEITGPGLKAPLEITDPAILDSFSIWVGPGVRMNGQPIHLDRDTLARSGAFIDWSQGEVVGQPRGSAVYTITFHQRGREPMHEWHRRYVVTYKYDPSAAGGYMYLPGPDDGEAYQRNVFSISHGVEGNWFHASPAWEQLVRPRIQDALTMSIRQARP